MAYKHYVKPKQNLEQLPKERIVQRDRRFSSTGYMRYIQVQVAKVFQHIYENLPHIKDKQILNNRHITPQPRVDSSNVSIASKKSYLETKCFYC